MKQKSNKGIIVLLIVIIVVLIICLGVLFFIFAGRNNNADYQLSLADKYISEGRYKEAIIAYEKAIAIDSRCEDAYLGISSAYAETRNYSKAIEYLEKLSDFTESESVKATIAVLEAEYKVLQGEGEIPKDEGWGFADPPENEPQDEPTPQPVNSPEPVMTEEDLGYCLLVEGVNYPTYSYGSYSSVPEYDVVISYKNELYGMRIHPSFDLDGVSAREDLFFKIFDTSNGKIGQSALLLYANDGVCIFNIEQDFDIGIDNAMQFEMPNGAVLTSVTVAPIPAMSQNEAWESNGENLSITAINNNGETFSISNLSNYLVDYGPTGCFGIEINVDWDNCNFYPN